MLKIICVGKLKEDYIVSGINDYLKRIKKFVNIEIIELKDSDMINEKELILKKVSKKDYIITLEIDGNNISSLDLSKKIDSIRTYTSPDITFIIGGSNGLHDDVKNISNYKLSFSKMTFPHGLFRLILLEQIYRSYKILNNEEYHK